MEKHIEEILSVYNEVFANTIKALENAGIPKDAATLYLCKSPKFDELSPQNVIIFYEEIRKNVILYLSSLGFSQREISRRLGGSSYHIVAEVLQINKKQNESTRKEV